MVLGGFGSTGYVTCSVSKRGRRNARIWWLGSWLIKAWQREPPLDEAGLDDWLVLSLPQLPPRRALPPRPTAGRGVL